MADSNNTLADRLPSKPYPALRTLERLVGTWDVTGPFIEGQVKFEWLKGEFFLVQHVDVHRSDHNITGVEYIGFDEDTETLRSHYMDNNGSNFTYTWEITGDVLKIWFGDKGSDNFFEGHFAENGDSYSGKWQWPGGGYEATMTRTK
jgi:hypothetical protein